MCEAGTQCNMFFISLAYIHACANKIDDVEALILSTRVCNRCVHDNLHDHMYMSIMSTPNLIHMHVDVYMNCKPRMTV